VGAVFRGAMRRDTAEVSARVQRKLQTHADLAERVRLFLVNDPTATGGDPSDADWDEDPLEGTEPVFLALPAGMQPLAPAAEEVAEGGDASRSARDALPPLAFALLAGCTSLYFGFECYANSAGGSSFANAAPLAGYLLGLQALHEASHVVAAQRHNLHVRPALLVASLPVGCFGGHTPLASYPANRSALFDFAAAGPLVGGVCSAVVAIAGLLLTAGASDQAIALMPTLPYETLHASFLVSLLTELALGPPSATASATELSLHPLAIAGFVGILSNAVALIPCGRLDGGRLAMAVFGRRAAAALGGLSLVILGVATLLSDEMSLLAFWPLIIVLLFRQAEVPCIDEVSEVDDARSRMLLPIFALAILVLLPAPHADPLADFDIEVLQTFLS